MTSTSVRAAAAANRDAGVCVDDDLRSLSDQLRRCAGRRGLHRWQALAERLGAFAVTHVMSVLTGCALAGGLWSLIR
jgi:hypothetical protein